MGRKQYGERNYMEKRLHKERRLNGEKTRNRIKNNVHIYEERTWMKKRYIPRKNL